MAQRIKYIADDAAARFLRGLRVNRAAAALPQTATAPLFTIAGGRILVVQLVGQITTVVQAQACNLKLSANPTVGGAVDICANLDINGLAAGILLGITGTFANAMVQGLALPAQATPTIVDAGTIDAITSASNTGAFKWQLRYIPLDDGVTVVAA